MATIATIAELLATSLEALKKVQLGGDFMIVKSGELSPTHIKRLVANNFLKPIIGGCSRRGYYCSNTIYV